MLLSDTTSGRGLFFHRPSPALLIEASCGCSHRLPTSFLAWIFPRVPNWLKVLLLTPKQILGGPREVVPVCSWTQGRTDKPRNKKHIRVYFGMLHLLVTNIVKPSAPGHSLARFWFFCKLAGDAAPPQPPFSHSWRFLCWHTSPPHITGLDAWSAWKISCSQPLAAPWWLQVLPRHQLHTAHFQTYLGTQGFWNTYAWASYLGASCCI